MGTTLACILYLGHIKLIKYYILATRMVVRSRATGWVFNWHKSYNILPCGEFWRRADLIYRSIYNMPLA